MITTKKMHDLISEEFTKFKRDKTTREHRMQFAEQLTEQYFADHEFMPDGTVLDRLGTLILQDELADTDIHKTAHNERPLLSDRQAQRRYERENSMKAAQDVATDGKDYRVKTRDSNRRMREIFGD